MSLVGCVYVFTPKYNLFCLDRKIDVLWMSIAFGGKVCPLILCTT